MSDFIDQTDEREAVALDAMVYQIRQKSIIDPGVAGECWRCGELSARLVRDACAPCRDRYKLP
jgi:hypothetical protein